MSRDNAQTQKPLISRIEITRKAKRERTYTLSFRVGEGYVSKLDTIGAKRGNSIHEQAREVLISSLDGSVTELLKLEIEIAHIRAEAGALRAEVEALRAGLELVLTGLVHSVANAAGESLSLKDAQSFVTNAFQRKGKSKDALN
jgi:hypothetical protein